MFKCGDKVRLKKDVKLCNGEEYVVLWGSDGYPSKVTLLCVADEKDGYVDVIAAGFKGMHLLAKRLRHETADDLD